MYKKVSTIINGQEFAIETGKVAKQASGSAWVTVGRDRGAGYGRGRPQYA